MAPGWPGAGSSNLKFGPATVSTSVAAPAATVACDRNIFVSERKAEKGNQNCENAWKGQSQRAAAHSTCARRTRAPTVLAEDSRAPIASPTAIAKRSTPPNSGTSRPRSCSGIAMRSVAFWRRCKSKNPVSLQLEQEFYAFMCKCPRHDLKYVRPVRRMNNGCSMDMAPQESSLLKRG